MKFLITGHAGFIGFSLVDKLIEDKNNRVIGLDNFNNYYDVKLKKKRVNLLKKKSKRFSNFKSFNCDIRNEKKLRKIFLSNKFDIVIHLAAQAGIRYTLKKPREYITNNILGFFNIIDLSKSQKVKKFIYASSSSVYGNSKKKFSKETDNVNKPLQIYAASKVSNELIAHAYSHLYNLSTTGIRFFTVYGPWGRPDMAIYKFTKKILKNKKITLYNQGKNFRDFTYIDDVTKGIVKILKYKDKKKEKYKIVNIGNNKPVRTLKMLNSLEKLIGKKSKKIMFKNINADTIRTGANINLLKEKYKVRVNTRITHGLKNFVNWYKNFI